MRKRVPPHREVVTKSLRSQMYRRRTSSIELPVLFLHMRNVACAILWCNRGCYICTHAMFGVILAYSGCGKSKGSSGRVLSRRVIDGVDADPLVPFVGEFFEPPTDLLGHLAGGEVGGGGGTYGRFPGVSPCRPRHPLSGASRRPSTGLSEPVTPGKVRVPHDHLSTSVPSLWAVTAARPMAS